jgi:hypothetical protein
MQFQYNTFTIISLVILTSTLFYTLCVVEKSDKELFTPEVNPLTDIIFDHMTLHDTDYPAYIKMLVTNQNTNLNIIQSEVYYEFKTLHNLDLLTKDLINTKY